MEITLIAIVVTLQVALIFLALSRKSVDLTPQLADIVNRVGQIDSRLQQLDTINTSAALSAQNSQATLQQASTLAGQLQSVSTSVESTKMATLEATTSLPGVMQKTLLDDIRPVLALQSEAIAVIASTLPKEILQLQDVLRTDQRNNFAAVHEQLALGRQEANAVMQGHTQSISAVLPAIGQQFTELRTESSSATKAIATSVAEQLQLMRDDAGKHRSEVNQLQEVIHNRIGQQLNTMVETLTHNATMVRETIDKLSVGLETKVGEVKLSVEGKLVDIQQGNEKKLEEMRATVDEKLHATLEQRLGESFKLVSDRLEQVHKGLGEMQTLATGVGDLKRVLNNVKTRGGWGEMQLATLLEQILTADQFLSSTPTRPGSNERVDFAIRLPGKSDGIEVLLPIDAKFPVEDYQRLLDAQEKGDLAAVEEAGKGIELRIKAEAKSISGKYIQPPHTTDFAFMYLPIEGLYAEVLRRPGLAETLQRDYRVSIAGPTTLSAVLNSLQMGFRTLAIEQRSSEVWSVLGAVKSEFAKFGDALAHTKKKLEEAHSSIENTEKRNRVLTKKLGGVDALPASEAEKLLGIVDTDQGSEEMEQLNT